MDAWDKQFIAAGQAVGLASANFKKHVANIWQFPPLVAEYGHLMVSAHGCFNGSWQGRRASATGDPATSRRDRRRQHFHDLVAHPPRPDLV